MFVFVLHPWLKEDNRRGCSTSCWKGLTMVNSWTFLGCSGVQFSQPLCLLRRHTSFSQFLIWPTSQPKCICQLIKSIGGNCSNENSWYTCHGLPPYPKHYAFQIISVHVKHLGHRQQNRTPLTLPKIGKKGHVSIEIRLPRADQGRIFAMAVVLTGEDPIWWSLGGPTTGFCLFGDHEKVSLYSFIEIVSQFIIYQDKSFLLCIYLIATVSL